MSRRERGSSFDNRGFGDRTLPVRKARSFVIQGKPDDSGICAQVKGKSIVQEDERRRVRESVGAAQRGRKEFETVEYNPFQIEAYKSKYSRWIKSTTLTPSSTVKEGNITLYAFESCESPTGFWTVTQTETDKEVYFKGGQCNANYTIVITVYRIGVGNNGTTAGQTYSDTITAVLRGPLSTPYFGPSPTVSGQESLIIPTGTGNVEVFGPWSNTTYSGYYFTVDSLTIGAVSGLMAEDGSAILLESGSRIFLEGDNNFPIRLLKEDGFTFLTEDSFSVLQEGYDVIDTPIDNCGDPPGATIVPNGFRNGQCTFFYDITSRECFTGITNGCITSVSRARGPFGGLYFTRNPPVIGAPFMAWFLQAPNAGGAIQMTGAYNSNFYTSVTCEILSIVPSPPPTNPAGTIDNCGVSKYVPPIRIKESSWTCNCPDKTKKMGADVRSTFRSRRFDRDWSSSDAGTTEDCKHIYAAKTAAGVKFDVPTDVPAKLSLDRRTAALDPFTKWSR